MTWGATETISSLALCISAVGLLISYLSYRKASKHDEPMAWAEIHTIGVEDCWLLTLHLRNRTDFDIRANALLVPIEQVPIDSKRAFMLADYDEVIKAADNNIANIPNVLPKCTWHMKMPLSGDFPIIPSGTTGAVRAFITRGKINSVSKVKVELFYVLLMEKRKYLKRSVQVILPSSGLTLSIART